MAHIRVNTSAISNNNVGTLDQAQRMTALTQFAEGIAHSLWYPLNSSKMRLFSLKCSLDLDPDQEEDFAVVLDDVRRVYIIAENLFKFSCPAKLKVRPVSPSEITRQALDLLDQRYQFHNVFISVHRSDRLPLISGDPGQLKEAFANILVNACQAMASRSGTINIFEEIQESEGNEPRMIRIRFCDSGSGIPDELLSNIFEPFFTTKKDATGLGLSIAYRILANHGGSIDVDSTLEGTCFTVMLPAISNPDSQGIS